MTTCIDIDVNRYIDVDIDICRERERCSANQWRRDRLPTSVFLGFPAGLDSKESACNVGDLGSISGLRGSLGGGQGNPLLYSCLENPHGWKSLMGYS